MQFHFKYTIHWKIIPRSNTLFLCRATFLTLGCVTIGRVRQGGKDDSYRSIKLTSNCTNGHKSLLFSDSWSASYECDIRYFGDICIGRHPTKWFRHYTIVFTVHTWDAHTLKIRISLTVNTTYYQENIFPWGHLHDFNHQIKPTCQLHNKLWGWVHCVLKASPIESRT